MKALTHCDLGQEGDSGLLSCTKPSHSFPCRNYAAHIKRPFSVKYEPYTHSIELLDSPQMICRSLESVRDELHLLINALNVIS